MVSSSPISPPAGKKFYLFGYPVAHSAAPALHNHCFSTWPTIGTPNTYQIWSTSKVTRTMLDALSSDECGGSAVTMPIKALILPYLDEISPESQVTGACNTIVKVPSDTGYKLVGQNTDILGVRNALLRGLRLQFMETIIPSDASYPRSLGGAGAIIGGGATTRSAAYALTLLGLSPIFIMNRDIEEVHAVQESLPHLNFIHLRSPDDVEKHLAQPNSATILMMVCAIPSTAPVSHDERMVYTTASAVFTIPYRKPTGNSNALAIPNRRIFLEMAYKPRATPMLQVAMAHGWHGLNGIQAMIEQGLAQQRMWYTSNPTIEAGSDAGILGAEIERSARELCETMSEVVVLGMEVDKAINDEPVTA